jgi:hypothetical protein
MPDEFTWGPVGKKNHRADLRRHGDFVFYGSRFRGISKPLKYFIGHTFLHLLSYGMLIVKSSFSKTLK